MERLILTKAITVGAGAAGESALTHWGRNFVTSFLTGRTAQTTRHAGPGAEYAAQCFAMLPSDDSKKASGDVLPSALGLRGVRLLAGLEIDVLERLAQQCRWRRYAPDQRVISREATDHDVYLIVSGRVRITAFSGAGRQVTYRDIGAGDWFGDLAAIDGLARSADVDALEETLMASVSPAAFRRLVHEYPAVCDCVLTRLVALVRDLTERVFDFSTLGVQNRVHAEVLRLAKQAGVQGNQARIDPAPKHADIASKVSTYREQVTRELSAMVKLGLLQRSGRALVVPDVGRLEIIVAEVRRSA